MGYPYPTFRLGVLRALFQGVEFRVVVSGLGLSGQCPNSRLKYGLTKLTS